MIHSGFLNFGVDVFFFFFLGLGLGLARQKILDSIRGNITHWTGTTV